MKKIGLLLGVALTLAITLYSCEGTSDPREKTEKKGGDIAKIIEKHIIEMESQPWNKAVYIDIKKNQIDSFTGSSEAKKSLYELLDFSYGIVLVREGNTVLDACDKEHHGHLKKVMTELNGFPGAKDGDKLKSRYNKHEEMVNFIGSLSEKQKVNSLSDKYDFAFEKDKEKKAKEYLATSPTCEYITSNLRDTKTYFQKRRKDYADKLVKLYCAQKDYDQTVELRVKGNINSACGSLTKEQSQKMSEFKERKLKEAQDKIKP